MKRSFSPTSPFVLVKLLSVQLDPDPAAPAARSASSDGGEEEGVPSSIAASSAGERLRDTLMSKCYDQSAAIGRVLDTLYVTDARATRVSFGGILMTSGGVSESALDFDASAPLVPIHRPVLGRAWVETKWPLKSAALSYTLVVKLPRRYLDWAQSALCFSDTLLAGRTGHASSSSSLTTTPSTKPSLVEAAPAALQRAFEEQTTLYGSSWASVNKLNALDYGAAWREASGGSIVGGCNFVEAVYKITLEECSEGDDRQLVSTRAMYLLGGVLPPPASPLDATFTLNVAAPPNQPSCALLVASVYDDIAGLRTLFGRDYLALAMICAAGVVALRAIVQLAVTEPHVLCFGPVVASRLNVYDKFPEQWLALKLAWRDLSLRSYERWVSGRVRALASATTEMGPYRLTTTTNLPLAQWLINACVTEAGAATLDSWIVDHLNECASLALFRTACVVYHAWLRYEQYGDMVDDDDDDDDDDEKKDIDEYAEGNGLRAVDKLLHQRRFSSSGSTTGHTYSEAWKEQAVPLALAAQTYEPLLGALERLVPTEHCILRKSSVVRIDTSLPPILRSASAIRDALAQALVRAALAWLTMEQIIVAESYPSLTLITGDAVLLSSTEQTRFYTREAYQSECLLAKSLARVVNKSSNVSKTTEEDWRLLKQVRASMRKRIDRIIGFSACVGGEQQQALRALMAVRAGIGPQHTNSPLLVLCEHARHDALTTLAVDAPHLTSFDRYNEHYELPRAADTFNVPDVELGELLLIDPLWLPAPVFKADLSRIDEPTMSALDEHQRATIALLPNKRLLTITGLGGCGKTQCLSVALCAVGAENSLVLCQTAASCDVVRTRCRGIVPVATLNRALVQHRRAVHMRAYARTCLSTPPRTPAGMVRYAHALAATSPFDYVRVVFFDESSLLSLEILASVLSSDALSTVEMLVFIGDVNQLPPVAWGQPYVDIVRATREPLLDSYCALLKNHRALGRSIVDNAAALARYHQSSLSNTLELDYVSDEYELIRMDDDDDMGYAETTLCTAKPTREQIVEAIGTALACAARRAVSDESLVPLIMAPAANDAQCDVARWLTRSPHSIRLVTHTNWLVRELNKLVRDALFDVRPPNAPARPSAVFANDIIYVCKNAVIRHTTLFDTSERKLARLKRLAGVEVAHDEEEDRIEASMLALNNGQVLRIVRFYDQPLVNSEKTNELTFDLCRCGACLAGNVTCLDPTRVPPARRVTRQDEPPFSTWRHVDSRLRTARVTGGGGVPRYRVAVYHVDGQDPSRLSEAPAYLLMGKESQFDFGYAFTIHKAQGAGCGQLVFVAPKDSPLITWQHPYTATTRAERRDTILTVGDEFEKMCMHRAQARRSTVTERLMMELTRK